MARSKSCMPVRWGDGVLVDVNLTWVALVLALFFPLENPALRKGSSELITPIETKIYFKITWH